MPITRRYRDNQTGESHEVNWDKDREPSEREIEVLIRQAKRKQTTPSEPVDDRYWFNKPLSGGAIARWAKPHAEALRNAPDTPYYNSPDDPIGYNAERGFKAADRLLKRGTANVVDFAAGMADESTTLLDLATTAATFGGSKYISSAKKAADAAMELKDAAKVAKAANKAQTGVRLTKAADLATGARGAYNVGSGLSGDEQGNTDWSKAGFGAFELGLSALGYSHARGVGKSIDDMTESASSMFGPKDRIGDAVTTEGQYIPNKYKGEFGKGTELPGRVSGEQKLLNAPTKFFGNETGVVSTDPNLPGMFDHNAPIGPELPPNWQSPVKPSLPTKRLGSGTTFAGYGDVVGDIRNKPEMLDQILSEADRLGIQESRPGTTIPRRSAPYTGTGSSLYNVEGDVVKGRVRNRGKGLRESIPKSVPERIPSTELPDIDVTPLRSELVEPTSNIKSRALGNIDEAVPVDPKAIVNNIYKNMDVKVLEVLRKHGDKGAIKELAHRRGETGSLFGGEKRQSPLISDEAKAKVRGFGARIKTGASNILDNFIKDETGAIKFGDDSNKALPHEEKGRIASFPFKGKTPARMGDLANELKTALKSGDESTVESIATRIRSELGNVKDRDTARMHYVEFGREVDYAKTPDEAEFFQGLRDDAAEKFIQLGKEQASAPPQRVKFNPENRNQLLDENGRVVGFKEYGPDNPPPPIVKKPEPKLKLLSPLSDETGAVTISRYGKKKFIEPDVFEPESNPKVILKKVRDNFPEAQGWRDTRFLMPDGKKLAHDHYIHESALNEIGTDIPNAGKAGIIRITEGMNGAEIQSPVTHEQAIQLSDMPMFANRDINIDVHDINGKMQYRTFEKGTKSSAIYNWVNSHFHPTPENKRPTLLDRLKSEKGAVTIDNPFYKDPNKGKTTSKATVVSPSQANAADAQANSPDAPKELPKRNIITETKRALSMLDDPDPHVQQMKEPYQEWVNTRAAAKGHSYNVRQDFKDLDALGEDAIHAYIKGERGGRLADVKKWWDEVHKKVILGELEETDIGRLWDNTDEEVQAVFGNRKLPIKKGAEFKTVLDTYKEGIAGKLIPRYKTMPEIMGFYSEAADVALADKKYYEFLDDKGIRYNKKVQAINQNYLVDNRNAVTKAALRGIQLTKDVAMASGLPGTAFNAHGFNMLRRSTVVNGVEGFVRSAGYMLNPGTKESAISRAIESVAPWESAAKVIEKNRQLIPEILQSGGRLGVEGHGFEEKVAEGALGKWGNATANKMTELHRELFETHLFDKMIPALKIDFYKSTVNDLVKGGMAAKEAQKHAARAMNLAFAGVNYEELATNKHVMDWMRFTLLAPDWYASNIGLANNIVKSFNPLGKPMPDAKIYQGIGKGLASAYVAANVLNYALTKTNSSDGKGKFMFQNDVGRSLDIDTGAYTISGGKKKKVYISPFGTAFDAIKIPFSVLNEVYKDATTGKGSPVSAAVNPFKNRLALPAHAAVNILSGYSDLGRSVRGRDAYGNDLKTADELKALGKEFANPFTPAYVKGIGGYALGDMSPLEATSQSIEAPFVFSTQPKPRGNSRSRPSRR